MGLNENKQSLLRKIPGVDHILVLAQGDEAFENVPKTVLIRSIRSVTEELRAGIIESNQETTEESLSDVFIIEQVKNRVTNAMKPNLVHIVNATGVVIHTNLGRSLLAEEALDQINVVSSRYSNLEYDLETGKRGQRYRCVEDIICEISGAEAAMVVNNNAGAVLLCLETIARDKKVIISRGELVEIGGSFRIPDVMAKSGGILCEVGTTNRTHLKDYERAIENDTGLLLKVHTSNYSVVGFTAEVPLKELVVLGSRYHIPVMKDLGSGTFIDFSDHGLIKEPTVQESVASGADVITFSGDKLLGGPQAGIIVGKQSRLTKIRKNPLARALRIDKLTLAALESTMRLYRDPDQAVRTIPTLRMLMQPLAEIETKVNQLVKMIKEVNNPHISVRLMDCSSRVGGGALPMLDLPSKCVGLKVKGMAVNEVEKAMRQYSPPVIGRIEEDVFIMDLRTVAEDELLIIKHAMKRMT